MERDASAERNDHARLRSRWLLITSSRSTAHNVRYRSMKAADVRSSRRSRGRSSATGCRATMWLAGPAESTTTSSASAMASSRSWVTKRIVLRSEEHTSELQSRFDLVCRLLLEKKIVVLQFERIN